MAKCKKRLSRELFSRRLCRVLTVSTCPGRLIGGGIFTAALLALMLLHTDEFLHKNIACGALLYGLCLAACGIMGLLTMLRIGMAGDRAAGIVSVIVYLLLPIVAMTMVECLNGVFTCFLCWP